MVGWVNDKKVGRWVLHREMVERSVDEWKDRWLGRYLGQWVERWMDG